MVSHKGGKKYDPFLERQVTSSPQSVNYWIFIPLFIYIYTFFLGSCNNSLTFCYKWFVAKYNVFKINFMNLNVSMHHFAPLCGLSEGQNKHNLLNVRGGIL